MNLIEYSCKVVGFLTLASYFNRQIPILITSVRLLTYFMLVSKLTYVLHVQPRVMSLWFVGSVKLVSMNISIWYISDILQVKSVCQVNALVLNKLMSVDASVKQKMKFVFKTDAWTIDSVHHDKMVERHICFKSMRKHFSQNQNSFYTSK